MKVYTYIYLLFITLCATLLLGRINIGGEAEHRENRIRHSPQLVMESQTALKCTGHVCARVGVRAGVCAWVRGGARVCGYSYVK